MTSVGNELGQVLVSVLTAAEGPGLRDMARGLQERYRHAGADPPRVLYVDRDCCRTEGGLCATAALFPDWPMMMVRLDAWHFMRRMAVAVTSESHPLYAEFMQRLSCCIFEWDGEDLSCLKRAKESDRSRIRNVIPLREMAQHCRRRTRGAEETEHLVDELLQAFVDATDTMSIPLLDRDRMTEIWKTQRKHIACIQVRPLPF